MPPDLRARVRPLGDEGALVGTWWERLSHRRRGILGVFALLAVLAIAAFVTERVTGSGGHEVERAALTDYVEALRPAVEINVTIMKRLFTVPDGATAEDYVALYHDAEKQLAHALELVQASKPPKELADGHRGVIASFSAYATMYRRAAVLFDHLVAVEHTPAELDKHRVELQKIFEAGFSVSPPRKWATELGADYDRLHLDLPQWIQDYARQMRQLLKTLESPQP
jgi:hypothetical protein